MDQSTPSKEILIEDITIWRHRIRAAEHAVLPSSTSRPNPLALADLVVASVCSPGSIYAVDRHTGKRRWRVRTGALAAGNVTYVDEALYGMTSQTLFALDPATGHVRWTFCPYGTGHEWKYSSPTVKDGRLFIGDRAGLFHCLNTKTGGWIWWRQISRARNRAVNATAIVRDDLAIVAANSGLAVGFEAATGRQVWRTKLDGPATSDLRLFQRQVLVATRRSMYLLRPSDGEVIHYWSWKGKEVKSVATANEKIFVIVEGKEKSVNGRAGSPAKENARLICLRMDRVIFEQAASQFTSALRWDRSSGELYESRIDGFGIIDGRTGGRTHEIKSRDRLLHPGLADLRDGIIYLLSMKGVMYALRHP
jgi:hypothetical protein